MINTVTIKVENVEIDNRLKIGKRFFTVHSIKKTRSDYGTWFIYSFEFKDTDKELSFVSNANVEIATSH